jgi:hypothetical protein
MSCCASQQPIVKDPDARLDYTVDWATWLTASDSDTLASVDFTVTPVGLTVDTSTFTTTDATVWLTGGTVGVIYTVNCRVTTAAGRIEDSSFRVRVREK